MPLKTLNGHLLITANNKLATDTACCCQCECPTSLDLAGAGNRREIILTLGNSATQTKCFDEMTKYTYENGYFEVVPSTVIECVGGVYQNLVYTGTCNVTLFWSVTNFPDCDCDSLDNCEFTVTGWENEAGCPSSGSVVDVQMGDLC